MHENSSETCYKGCCQPIPCHLCKGNSATWVGIGDDRRLMTSVEWCQEMDACAAMIDWEKIYGVNNG